DGELAGGKRVRVILAGRIRSNDARELSAFIHERDRGAGDSGTCLIRDVAYNAAAFRLTEQRSRERDCEQKRETLMWSSHAEECYTKRTADSSVQAGNLPFARLDPRPPT